MTTTTLATIEDPAAQKERLAIGGFLAGYIATTRAGYTTDLRGFVGFCDDTGISILEARRTHIELFCRSLETRGLMPSTIARRVSTLASFYRYCEQEELIARNPAINVRRPKVDPESRTKGLDRNELGAFLVQAGMGTPRDHALASLLALNGLRVSEALNADIDALDFDRGHRTLRIVRKVLSADACNAQQSAR